MTPPHKTQHPLKGVLFFITAIFLISVVDTICKFFTKDLHSIQLVWGYFVGINLILWIFFFLTFSVMFCVVFRPNYAYMTGITFQVLSVF